MATKLTIKKAEAINQMIEDLLLQRFEFEVQVLSHVRNLNYFHTALDKSEDSYQSFRLRKSIDIFIEKKSISERSINALNNNIRYYSDMLIKSK